MFLLQSGGLGRNLTARNVDANFSSVVLLMHGNGTNGSTSFPDSSLAARTLTAVGNAQVSTTDSKWGAGCALFDGTGDSITAADSNDFRFGTGDFTVEAWVRLASTGAFRNIVRHEPSAGNAWHLRIGSNDKLQFGSTGVTVESTGTLSSGVWYHCAASRIGSTLRVFIDGVGDSATSSTDYNGTSATLHIGGSSFVMDGRIEDVRITKGVGRHSADFTPPTGPYPNS